MIISQYLEFGQLSKIDGLLKLRIKAKSNGFSGVAEGLYIKGYLPMHDVKHISIYIHRLPGDVYEFAANPENLPRWAAGLASSELKREKGVWVADAPFGKVRIKFAQSNTFGVMDHDVELDSGVVVHNPMRVVPNGEGSEFIFTLLRQAEMSEQQFLEDAQAVDKDLRRLKELLEGGF